MPWTGNIGDGFHPLILGAGLLSIYPVKRVEEREQAFPSPILGAGLVSYRDRIDTAVVSTCFHPLIIGAGLLSNPVPVTLPPGSEFQSPHTRGGPAEGFE